MTEPKSYAFAICQQDSRELTGALVEFVRRRKEDHAAALISCTDLIVLLIRETTEDPAQRKALLASVATTVALKLEHLS